MNIRIETGALLPQSKGHIIRSMALSSLIRLKERGHTLTFHGQSLGEAQLGLLAQENITSEAVRPRQADISISANEGDLLLTTHTWQAYRKFTNWQDLVHFILNPERKAEIHRKTSETDITVRLNLDGTGESDISTGLGFFDHMLDQIAKHGYIDLQLKCKGDLHVDEHHTIEDVAIVVGEAISKAVADKRGIGRYGFVVAMDESLATIALDLSGRPVLEFQADFKRELIGDFPSEMIKHFFYSLSIAMNATLHMEVKGDNDHHKIEALFKGFARCLRQAVDKNEQYLNVLPSSKGKL